MCTLVQFSSFFNKPKRNMLGENYIFQSSKVFISVAYVTKRQRNSESFPVDAPEVEVKIRGEQPGGSRNIQEGNSITLECSVKRSNPQPTIFTWLKNGRNFGMMHSHVFNAIRKNDTGSYTCTAQNQIGSKESEPYHLQVHCKFKISFFKSNNNHK